jgi:hypothetical protein
MPQPDNEAPSPDLDLATTEEIFDELARRNKHALLLIVNQTGTMNGYYSDKYASLGMAQTYANDVVQGEDVTHDDGN